MANTRTCLVCGKTYEFCGSCPTSLKLPTWKNLYDTKNCKDIFRIVSDYDQKVISKSVAKKKLNSCDLSGVFKDNIQKLIDEINADFENTNTETLDNSVEVEPVKVKARRKPSIIKDVKD